MKKVMKNVETAAKDVAVAAKDVAAAAKTTKAAKAVSKTVKEAADVVTEKTAEVTEEVKRAVKKTAASAKAPKETVYLQYLGKEINKDDIVKQVKEIWTKELGEKVSEMESVVLYLKPEENKAYYVINDTVSGSIDM